MPTTTPLTSVFDRMLSLSRAMDDALGSVGEETHANGRQARLWLPVMDIYETANALVVQLDLPGVSPENVEISFEQNTLTVSGTRAPTLSAPEQGEFRVYAAERVSGNFVRSIRLPEYAEPDKIEAHDENGVLTITIPKAASALPKKIAIKSGSGAKRLSA